MGTGDGDTWGGSQLSRLRCPGCREGPGILCGAAPSLNSQGNRVLWGVTAAPSCPGLCALAGFCSSV